MLPIMIRINIALRAFLNQGANLDPDPSDPYVFGPPGTDPDPLVRRMDPDPSIIKQKL